MRKVSHDVPLTSAEVANLWTQYINDSLSICMLTHCIEKSKDQDIKDVLEFALQIAKSHLPQINEFYNQEGWPIPKGFSIEEDVNLSTPPLFTDIFMLIYMQVMTLLGLTGYAGAIATSARSDQMAYFIKCNTETMELYKRIIEILLEKGIYSKPPRINVTEGNDMIHRQGYLTGWFGKKRPLNVIEISSISFNMLKLVVKVVMEIGFAQVAKTKDIQKYFERGHNICEKEFDGFRSILAEDLLPTPASWVSEVTNTTIAPYSEKLMLNHIVVLVSAAVGYFGAGLSVSQRRDLGLEYTRDLTEIMLYAEDGAQLLIKYGWLESPPLAPDREDLARKN